jgi:cysteine-rich repeat protein
LDTSELCDDGNRLNGDGCDRYCRIEKNPTQVASDISDPIRNPQFTNTGFPQFQNIQQYGFPQYPNFKQLPYQLPLAQLRPIVQQKGPVGDTGPAAVAIVGAGAAAGLSWIRRKRR